MPRNAMAHKTKYHDVGTRKQTLERPWSHVSHNTRDDILS